MKELPIHQAYVARTFGKNSISNSEDYKSILFMNGNYTSSIQTDKCIFFGELSSENAKIVGVKLNPFVDIPMSRITNGVESSYSSAKIIYQQHDVMKSPYQERYFKRYDFTDEWNNLGYGAIEAGGPWGIGCCAEPIDCTILAYADYGDGFTIPFITVKDYPDFSVLWINRLNGLPDGLDGQIIERFVSDYRSEELACIPSIGNVPEGYCAGVTMRLDCDQNIISAKKLFDYYQTVKMPFSVAVCTSVGIDEEAKTLLAKILMTKGAVLSHSVNHITNWGETEEIAYREAYTSKKLIEEALPGNKVRFGVSPFHTNAPYSVQSLAKAGYYGFIGGIIHNDPEFLVGYGGVVPGCTDDMITHSQQCMVHGDCYHRAGNKIDIYLESFRMHYLANSIWGYLDHPFSDAYQYGWYSEEERIGVHAAILDYVRGYGNIWYCNEGECLDFILKRSSIALAVKDGNVYAGWDERIPGPLPMIRYNGKHYSLGKGMCHQIDKSEQ